MNASTELIDFLKNTESLSLKPYKDDKAGTSKIEYSIGYGHQILPGEEWMMNGITRAKAEELLVSDLAKFNKAVNDSIRVSLTQYQFDSLVHFSYNVGVGAFAGSTLAKKVNEKASKSEIESEFRKWIYAEGKKSTSLQKRRESEIKIWGGSFPFYVKKKVIALLLLLLIILIMVFIAYKATS